MIRASARRPAPAMNETDKEANLHAPEGDVTVADRRADDPYPDLVRLGRVDDDLLDGQRLPGGPAHGRCSPPGRKTGQSYGYERRDGRKKKATRGNSSGGGREESKSMRQSSGIRLRTFASDGLGAMVLHGRRLAGVATLLMRSKGARW